MDSIRLLDDPEMERAMRRYVLAQNLFDHACYSVLDAEGAITPVAAILSTVDSEMAEATGCLESILQGIVSARVEEALIVAGLLQPTLLPRAA